jgi:hypothetical protein
MPKDTVEIPVSVLSSVKTLDELEDWLTAQNPQLIAELREARRQDLAGEFKAWEPRLVQCTKEWKAGRSANRAGRGAPPVKSA